MPILGEHRLALALALTILAMCDVIMDFKIK